MSLKKVMYVKNIIFGIHAVVKWIHESHDKEAKTILTKINKKKACKTQKFYILLAFLLITIASLKAVSIYYYLIKYRAKQNIYYHFTKQIMN